MITQKKILVVDDDRDILESITMILTSAGYDVLSADSSGACRDVLEKEHPDMIILDIMMDTMTEGISLAMELKSDPESMKIPVIIVSSIEKYTGFPIDRDYLKVDDCLEKPLKPQVLIDTVGKYLG